MDFFSRLISLKIIPFIRKWNLLNFLLGAMDILAITIAFQLSYNVNYSLQEGLFFSEVNFLLLYLSILPFWLLILYFINVTEIPRTKRYSVLFFEYFQSALAVGIVLLIIYFVFKMSWISRLFLIQFVAYGFILLFLVRVIEYILFKRYRAKGYNYINVVLIADNSSIPFIDLLLLNKEWGYRVTAIFSESQKVKEKYEKTIILLQQEYLSVLHDLIEGEIVDEVFYIKSKIIPSEIRDVIRSCEEMGITFRLKYDDEKINLTNAIKTNIENIKFLTFINVPYNSYALAAKKVIDIVFSLLLIIFLFPVLLIISILIKTSSKGTLIYKHPKVGLR